MNGFAPGELNLTATGQQMRIRYPEGFVSNIDADLALLGSAQSPLLRGTVTVHDALYSKRFEPNADIFNLGSGGAPLAGAVAAAAYPLRFDVQIDAPSALRVENNLARMVASADLQLRGTYDRPLLFGSAQIERGDVIFEGNRYLVTRGTIGFANPARIEPYFDIEAETRVRVAGAGQSIAYRVTLGFTGTATRMAVSLNSDPPLSQVGIALLLFGQTSSTDLNAELRMLNPTATSRSEEDLLKAATARLLTGSISAPVNRAVEQTLGVDLQITPSIGTSETESLTPSARLILGRRLSSRAYVTFARPLGTASGATQILVLEYDQNDRVGWVLTQNGDRTFSIDFRVQHRR
jgi:autotransporter translocation and assembly factor TamB